MEKNIKIICCINNNLNLNDFTILTYDKDNNLVDKINTTNNKACINITDDIKSIRIETNNNNIVPNVIYKNINENYFLLDTLYLNFLDNRFLEIPITVTITDQHYPGLVIEKGSILID